MEHGVALTALLYLPVAVMLALTLIHAAGEWGVTLARSLAAHYMAASPWTKMTVLLMLASASIHLALIPDHMCPRWSVDLPLQCVSVHVTFRASDVSEPYTAFLFALDGAGLIGASILAFMTRSWKPFAAALLTANVAAYFAYLGSGKEIPDGVGLTCKAIELGALALLMIQWRLQRVLMPTAAANHQLMTHTGVIK